jgi:hypothetical protein
MPELKQRYDRTYGRGRPTAGWERGERITDVSQVKPGDHVIEVCHQFQAENLALVIPRPDEFSPIHDGQGFYSVWANNQTGERTGPEMMFTWDFELGGERREFYRAIDRRRKPASKQRIRADKLPSWLSYK